MSFSQTGHKGKRKIASGRLDSPPPHHFGQKNHEYDGSTSGNSSTTQATYQQKKRSFQSNKTKERPAVSEQQNVPSFITQVNKDGKPQQYFASAEENQEEEDEDDKQVLNKQEKKEKSFLAKLCSCLKFRKVKIDAPQEVNLTDQKVEQEKEEQEVEEEVAVPQNYAKPPPKQKLPLQTNLPQEIKNQDQKYYGKKSLVIDLDETLVHSSFTKIDNADFVLNITVQNMPFMVYIKKRPGCEFFLEELSKYYELIIFTASLAEYANPVMDKIDKHSVCALRLFRENCTLYNGVFVKDMSLMNRDLKDIIIIDNSETSFLFQPVNAVHIKSYFDDPKDRELYRLIPVLIFLSNSYDVRPVANWWREFEHNEFVDYRDRRNRLQRLDKMRMLNELGDLRKLDLQMMEAESIYENNNQVIMNSPQSADSMQSSPKGSAEPLQRKENNIQGNQAAQQQQQQQSHQQQQQLQDSNKKRNKDKKSLEIAVPAGEESDILPAARKLDGSTNNQELESVRNKLLAPISPSNSSLMVPPSPQNTSDFASSTKASGILSKNGFKFNEFEDVSKIRKDEDPHSFKTQPDSPAEDSEMYKQMKSIYDNIRYEQNSHNFNSPVAKQRFVQLFHSNSQRKVTDKNSTTNSQQKLDEQNEQPHFFTSPKKAIQQKEPVLEAQEIQESETPSEIKYSSYKGEEQEDEDGEISNKTNDEVEMIANNDRSEDS